MRETVSSAPTMGTRRAGGVWLVALALFGCGDASSGEGDGAAQDRCEVVAEPTVVLHPQQPMVVDVELELAEPVEVSLAHDSDPGVRVERTDDGEGPRATFRVRGLMPGIEHALTAADGDGEACGDQATVFFEAAPALDGFTPAWEVTSGPGNGEPSSQLRVFDLSEVPAAGLSRMFVVDDEGTTRFFSGASTTLTGPSAVRAGVKLRPDGTLLYLFDDAIQIVDELGEVQLRIDAEQLGVAGLHHEVLELDDGNFLALAYTFRNIDYPGEGIVHVAGDLIVEVSPEGELVWSWNAFDHLDPLRVRDGFDFPVPDPANGEPGKDWTHGNGLVVRDGIILLSMRHQDWIVAIERDGQPTDGTIRWRLGPEGDFTLEQGRWFFHQHSPQWQPDGALLLYDNGVGNPDLADTDEVSRAVAFSLDETAMTAMQVWEDDAEPYTAAVAGDADRMSNGNYLVLDSSIFAGGDFHARLRELDPAGSPMQVWSIESEPGTFMYRAISTDRLVGEAVE